MNFSNQTVKIATVITNDININSLNTNQTGSNISTVTLPAASGIITTLSLTTSTAANTVFTANHPSLNTNKVVLTNIVGYSGNGIPHVRVNTASGSMQIVVANSKHDAPLNAPLKIAYVIL